MKPGYDYSVEVTVQSLTPLSGICIIGALVPAKPVLRMYHLWRLLGGALMWSVAGQ